MPRPRRQRGRGLALLAAAAGLARGAADFFYADFNDTEALRLNGDAATSSCDDGGPYRYSAAHGVNDASDGGPPDSPALPVFDESTTARHSTNRVRSMSEE